MSTARRAAWFMTAATVVGLLSFVRRYFANLADHREESPWPILVDEMTALWLVVLFILAVIALAGHFPVKRYWWSYLVAAPVYAVLHTLGMYGSRSILYPLFGLGPYNYGDLPYRFLMEAPVQLFGYALTVVGLVVYDRLKRARDAERLEGLLAEARLERLRLSIAPHFLFNTLNVISSAAYESAQKADELIGRLSRLLRALLAVDCEQTVPVARELDLLNEYLVLQKARFEDDLKIHVDCPDALLQAQVPFMILQPVVENALEHGRDASGRVTLGINIRRSNGTLVVDVTDRGSGCNHIAEGIGLRNTRERLTMQYGAEGQISLVDRPAGGTLAQLRMPLQCVS